jgi:serine/threonine protein kinase
MKFSAKRLAGEILMQSSVQHPNVVALHAVVLSPTHLAILMEPCRGGELNEYIRLVGAPASPEHALNRIPQVLQSGGRLVTQVVTEPAQMPVLGEVAACYFFAEILAGLESCHANHIAHRDLKFSNIVLGGGSPPEVKITDFGLAQHFFVSSDAAPGERSNGSAQSAKSTKSGRGSEEGAGETSDEDMGQVFARCSTRVGTPNYVPREIAKRSLCRSGYNGCAADVWSLGVMLFCMLTGKFPFPDLDGHLTLLKRLDSGTHNEMLAFIMAGAGLSEPAQELLTRMLHTDAEARITLSEIREHPWVLAGQQSLQGAVDVSELASGKRSFSLAAPPARRRRRPLTSRTHETFAKLREDLVRPFLRLLEKLGGLVESPAPTPPPPERRREPSPLDEDEARFRTAEDFPEKSWLQLRELIACAEEGPGHAREPLRLWLPAGGSFRLSRHREDGSVHDYRSDVKSPARQPAASAGSRGRT